MNDVLTPASSPPGSCTRKFAMMLLRTSEDNPSDFPVTLTCLEFLKCSRLVATDVSLQQLSERKSSGDKSEEYSERRLGWHYEASSYPVSDSSTLTMKLLMRKGKRLLHKYFLLLICWH